jgi:hypothetical protein
MLNYTEEIMDDNWAHPWYARRLCLHAEKRPVAGDYVHADKSDVAQHL